LSFSFERENNGLRRLQTLIEGRQ